MRYAGLIAAALMGAGLAGAQVHEWQIGINGVTSASNQADYHMGYGGGGEIGVESRVGDMTETSVGIRGNWLNYEAEADAPRADYQEWGTALQAMAGPTSRYFEPKVGGHIGYQRVDAVFNDRDALDVGFDVVADIALAPRVDLKAAVIPLWLIDEDDTDYQTRGSLGVTFGLGPGV